MINKTFDLIVPIGADCLPAMRLQELNLRNSSKPLDWLWFDSSIRSDSQFKVVVDLILSKFNGFLCEKNVVGGTNKKGHFIFRDKFSGFVFEHEEIKNLIHLSSVKEKYKKRIARLYEEISTSTSILFLYIEKNGVRTDVEDVLANYEKLCNGFKNKDVTLFFFINDESLPRYEYRIETIADGAVIFKINNSISCSPKEDPWQRNAISLYNALLQNIVLNERIHYTKSVDNPLITILIPTYKPDYKNLKIAINSVFNQTISNFEIIIVHDGDISELNGIEVFFSDPRLKIISGPGKGLSAALNKGIDLAKGEYIARLDADDIAMPNRLQKQIEFLQDNPDIDIVGSYQSHFGKTDYFDIHTPEIDPDLLKVILLFRCDMCHSTIMFKKSVFNVKNIRYPDFSLQEDFELWNSLLETVRFANIPEVLGLYRLSGCSITDVKSELLNDYEVSITIKSLKKYFNFNATSFSDILSLRKLNYDKKKKGERLKIQKRYCELFSILSEINRKVGYVDADKFELALQKHWKRLFWGEVLYPCQYSCEYKIKKFYPGLVCKITSFDRLYFKTIYKFCSVPLLTKIKNVNALKKIYFLGVEVYKHNRNGIYVFGVKISDRKINF